MIAARRKGAVGLALTALLVGLGGMTLALADDNPCPDLVWCDDGIWTIDCPPGASCQAGSTLYACSEKSGTSNGRLVKYCGCNDSEFGCCRAGLRAVGETWVPTAAGKCSAQDPSCDPGWICTMDTSAMFQRTGKCIEMVPIF